MEVPLWKKDAAPSLWQKAFDALPDGDKDVLKLAHINVQLQPSDIVHVVEEKKDECIKKQWRLYTNKAGEKVLVRDVLTRVADWLNRFKLVADTVVQYDPGHAAIPWAIVRALLQAAVNDCQTFGSMVESVETISCIIFRYTELEAKLLFRTSPLAEQLSAALVKLYGSALAFLARAFRYYSQSTFKRVMKSTIANPTSAVEKPILRIEKYEDEVYKLVSLVQNEITGVKLDRVLQGISEPETTETVRAAIEEKRKKFAAWINSIVTKNTYETALRYHHDRTCEWVLRLSEFRRWNSDESAGPKLLWIHGPPGFGKTILSACIIRHLQQARQAPLSYFFYVADNQLTRDPYAGLRSWLAQMLEQGDAVLEATDRFYRARDKDHTLSHLGLWELFVAIGNAIDRCTFVFDGFDECTDIDTGAGYHRNDPRNLFLREMLKHLARTKSRVLIVSRDAPDIREYLGHASTAESPGVERFGYAVTAKDTTDDVKSFSQHIVDTKIPKKPYELRQIISSRAAERSEGMFLWIKLLEKEISPGKNKNQLTEAVKNMPLGISQAYSRELDRITSAGPDRSKRAGMILRWVLFAVRPLQIKQLAEALAVSGDGVEEYPEGELPDCWHDTFVDEDYVNEMILGPCGSLIQLRSNSPQTALADHTVHFVHFSVKEYLSNLAHSATGKAWAAGLGLSDAASEERRLSEICLRYLAFDTFRDIPQKTEIYPFLTYAAWAWYFHGFHEKPTPTQAMIYRAQRAFDPALSSWRVWTPLLEAKVTDSANKNWSFRVGASEAQSDAAQSEAADSDAADSDTASESSEFAVSRTVQNPMYYASLLGLTDVVKWLETRGLGCDSTGGRFGSPLQAAVALGNENVVKHLLNRQVDVSQKGGRYGAAIIAAAAVSTPHIIECLLAAKADIRATDRIGFTALHHAAYRGNIYIVRQLLAHEAKISPAVAHSATAMLVACASRHTDVVSLLADQGADLSFAMRLGSMTLLEIATRNRDAGIAAFLIQRQRAKPDEIFFDRSRALHVAACSRNIVRTLLGEGVDPSLLNSKSFTPLQVAIVRDEIEAAKLLLESCADVNQKAKGGLMPLLLAVWMASSEPVSSPLDRGASMQCVSRRVQHSGFDMAADRGHLDNAALLVRRNGFAARTARAPRLGLPS